MTRLEEMAALADRIRELAKARFKDNPDYVLDPVSKRYKLREPKKGKGRKKAAEVAPPRTAQEQAFQEAWRTTPHVDNLLRFVFDKANAGSRVNPMRLRPVVETLLAIGDELRAGPKGAHALALTRAAAANPTSETIAIARNAHIGASSPGEKAAAAIHDAVAEMLRPDGPVEWVQTRLRQAAIMATHVENAPGAWADLVRTKYPDPFAI